MEEPCSLGAIPGQMSPTASQSGPSQAETKEWYQSITDEFRNHLVQKLVQAISPNQGPQALVDERHHNLIAYARKVEGDLFKMADSRSEYYHLSLEKMSEMKKGIEGKGPGPGQCPALVPTSVPAPAPAPTPALAPASARSPALGYHCDSLAKPIQNLSSVTSGASPLEIKTEHEESKRKRVKYEPMEIDNVNGETSAKQPGIKEEINVTQQLGIKEVNVTQQPGIKEEVNVKQQPSIKEEINVKQQPGIKEKINVKQQPCIKEELEPPVGLDKTNEGLVIDDKSVSSGVAPRMAPSLSIEPTPIVQPTAPKKLVSLFKPDELRQQLGLTLVKLYCQEPESIPFRQPVDPRALGIPDYFNLIKKPMDISTIKQKLDTGQYTDPWEYVSDVWLMFDNAWKYNRKSSLVYRYCTKLAKVFEEEIDPVVQHFGYCCGRKYTLIPRVLRCYGKQLCTILRDATYFSYQKRYTYCSKCFYNIQGDSVTLSDDPLQPTLTVQKSKFTEVENDTLVLEPLVECVDCGRMQHQICVFYMKDIWLQAFVCDDCLRKKNQKRQENKFTAKNFPTTKLSNFLEMRVNSFLKGKAAGAGEVYIRVVSSLDKTVRVKGGMKTRFVDTGQLSPEFPYRSKAIFAFQDIDGHDVCFFGMHVQEYGSDCPPPNTRRVYLAYLDIVHFFKPREYRTAVYHEILLGYLDYVKQLGYTTAHIWACPPLDGDDFIFRCHPSDQKIPKTKHLQDWNKKMLDKGIITRIVVDYKDIYKQANEDHIKSPADLPYFEGDFWPSVMEECIKELDQEEKRKQGETAAAMNLEEEVEEIDQNGEIIRQKRQTIMTIDRYHQIKFKSKNSSAGCSDLTQKIFSAMDTHKDGFFVIRLHSTQSAVRLPPIQDPDPVMVCDLMDGRNAFLTFASERYLEFSSLRHAKYSTMAMLYELHNNCRIVNSCNNCKAYIETRWHCQECNGFDLCVSCFKNKGHHHKMIKLDLNLKTESVPTENKNSKTPEAHRQSIKLCLQTLVHTSQCSDTSCSLPSCKKMKKVLSHSKNCKKKDSGGCPVCKQLIMLYRHHVKSCKEQKCVVLYCFNMKQKLKQQEKQQQQQQQLKRMQQMNACMPSLPQSTPSTSQGPPPPRVKKETT